MLNPSSQDQVFSCSQTTIDGCTRDAQFYTPYNYHRALIWSGVMTALSHLDPAFRTVASLQAVNEPVMDANQTPGYGQFQKNFVQVVRAVELALGIHVRGVAPLSGPSSSRNVTGALSAASSSPNFFNSEVRQVLQDMVPVLIKVAQQLSLNLIFDQQGLRVQLKRRSPLITNFMNVNWQYNNPSNPADAKKGPQAYDNHMYYSYGGVAAANEEAYMTHICNLDRIEQDAALGNSPLWFGGP
ncbi:hypothetical protein MD484_g4479, partial [Candolleomyces efflorescens]